ncbi:ABC transporter permease [Tropicimonas isoalkanivorans]|uniref:Putative spermidine/putrescine transport system permease protein n=1 Tax=Tropicimonas isoalkanivorans TaxID=441112 RepID=A0A1I1HZU4_9RHOB|nr:ABC transporter permease [Tropicimonas isoalkanivorans]SFC26953.1 putative spermidine/putrescine transport system permease protein [Tropicimonas isoalkanivorans]
MSRDRSLWLAVPALVFLLALFIWPLVRLFAGSFAEGIGVYTGLLTSDLYMPVLVRTFGIAAQVTLVALILAYPVSYLLATTSRGWRAFGFAVVMLPFWTSILVRTYAWMMLLGRNGPVNKLMVASGAIEKPLTLLNTPFAVIIGMVHVMVPFMILPIYNAMQKVDPAVPDAARSLGAGSWSVFARIYLPMTLQGVIAGITLVFVLSLGFFITPALLGGGRVFMFAMVIEQQVRESLNWELAGAMALVLLAVTLAVSGLMAVVAGRWLRWAR